MKNVSGEFFILSLNMNLGTSKRPSKRRKTKGVRRLAEDDDEAADEIAVRSIIQETEHGPVEEQLEVPVWLDRPINHTPRPVDPDLATESTAEPLADGGYDPGPMSPTAGRPARTQQYYMEQFLGRIHPMLKALLSREHKSGHTTCVRCPEGRYAR